ncbi:MAG TPA: Hsp70 family protein, partial [Gammaproteobacteria bacterium]|nr:Hsp70 family protein [Gammaproteobacteria bacterium]
KSLSELGDKVTGEERAAVEAAVSDLKDALKKDDKAAIEAKTQALAQVSGKLAERLYANKAEGASAAGAAPGGEQPHPKGDGQDNVVDAEFEEVKGDKK